MVDTADHIAKLQKGEEKKSRQTKSKAKRRKELEKEQILLKLTRPITFNVNIFIIS